MEDTGYSPFVVIGALLLVALFSSIQNDDTSVPSEQSAALLESVHLEEREAAIERRLREIEEEYAILKAELEALSKQTPTSRKE